MGPSTSQHDSPQLWVGLGRFDFPVQLQLDLPQLDLNKKPRFVMDFSQGTGDGYFEFRPLDFERASTSSWWSRDEPVLFEFRASVVAALPDAMRRASTFVEHYLDWLSLFHGVAAADPKWDYLFNETELEACRVGTRTEFTSLAIGTPTFSTGPARNLALATASFDEEVARSARWLRKAMLSSNMEDRFLLLFATCEDLSRRIKVGDKRTVTCPKCQDSKEIDPGVDHAGFKTILEELFGADGKRAYKDLNRLRGSIAHGGKHPKLLFPQLLQFEPVVKAAALASLAKVLGVSREALDLLNFGYFECGAVCVAKFDEKDPSDAWGRSITESLKTSSAGEPPPNSGGGGPAAA
jgi:hypothetical protein